MRKYRFLGMQVLLFLGVGLTTFFIDLAVTSSLYNFLGFPAFLASGIGFLSGFFFNFPMNRKKVFKHSEKDKFTLKAQVILYILLSLFNLFTTSLLVEVTVSLDLLTIGFAKILVTGLIATWNFLIFKLFIFSKSE